MNQNHKELESTPRITRKRTLNSDNINVTSNRIRKPLSDCINIINSTNPSQSSSTSTKNSTSIAKPTQILSKNKVKSQNENNLPNPSVVLVDSVSTPSRTPKPASDKGADNANREVLEPRSVYGRRQSADKRKGKQKAIAEPMSCFPALKTQVTRDEVNEYRLPSLSKSCVLPNKKKQRRVSSKEDDAKYSLPQDFIEQQRAYFAEIDAFELSEEEVASIDELD
ncbi:uncharacterized protein LOC126659815 [Mercurialis annua]|uniref:uncharacterized protein LOC126659815 n=1 Tax=Mercurialis annua TaxID=3986 RepID=UPI00215F942E|nr:uncharacterized protein LOC126659815 [Mercurialis annua]